MEPSSPFLRRWLLPSLRPKRARSACQRVDSGSSDVLESGWGEKKERSVARAKRVGEKREEVSSTISS